MIGWSFPSKERTKQKQADEIDRQIDALIKAAIEEANRIAREKALAEEKAKGNTTTSTSTRNVITKPAKTEEFALTAEEKTLPQALPTTKENFRGQLRKVWL